MSRSGSSLDIHMPLLAFAALMFEHGCDLSEAHWTAMEDLEDGTAMDAELHRAQAWLLAQDKGHAMGPLLRHLCARHESAQDDTDMWAQLVALPVAGPPVALHRLAQALSQMDLGDLARSGRIPSDAQVHVLPATFTGATVDQWWVTPRQGLLEIALDLAHSPVEVLRQHLAQLTPSLLPAAPAGHEPEVRLLLGVMLSRHPTWLAGVPEVPETHLIAVGEDLETYLEKTAQHLEAQGVEADINDEAFELAFQQAHGLFPEEAAEVRSRSLDHERRVWDALLVQAGVPEVEVHCLQTWSLALQDRAMLSLRQAAALDRQAHGLDPRGRFTQAYVAADDHIHDRAWVLAEDHDGVLWGPYAMEGIGLLGGLVPRMADEALAHDPEIEELPIQVCASPSDFPQHGRQVH